VHTAKDNLSNPEQLLTLAKEYPTVSFIMVHMGLCSDNELAIGCLTQAENLYGDTTWVPWDKVDKAIRICGSEKMMFGSDAPIDGNRSYAFYETLLEAYRMKHTPAMDNLMYKNAQRIFKL
jgi:predicted TIM-barrel fold metal-dependent hydrolase